jgi:xyloglucan-specific exo-beta-1,4-glucanase
MVAALNAWWPDELIWRSTDSGATWSPIWEWVGYPNLEFFYGYDISAAPWLQDDTSTEQFDVRVGWMVESLEIDPFDSNHWLYGTGATIYGSHDLLNWDSVHNVTIKSMATGIEETSVQGLIVPPGGPPLLSAVGDIGGFYHNSLTVAPNQAFHTPTYGTTNDLDYAGNSPANIVRSGSSSSGTDPQVAVSSNFGVSWNSYFGASSTTAPGKVAFSADASAILMMSPGVGPLVSRFTSTFSAVPTLPSGAAIASDKRNASVFYGGSGNR